MNTDGTWKIEPQFKRAGPYCGDRAAVQRVDGLWVYLDREGQEVGGPWDGAEAFTEGRGLVTSSRGATIPPRIYRHRRQVAISIQFAGARLFSEGLRRCWSTKMGLHRPRRQDGHQSALRRGRSFSGRSCGGACRCRLGKEQRPDHATGKFIIDPQYEQISRIGDRFWSVGITDRAHRGNGEPPLLSRLVDAEGHFVSRSPTMPSARWRMG